MCVDKVSTFVCVFLFAAQSHAFKITKAEDQELAQNGNGGVVEANDIKGKEGAEDMVKEEVG